MGHRGRGANWARLIRGLVRYAERTLVPLTLVNVAHATYPNSAAAAAAAAVAVLEHPILALLCRHLP